MPENDNFGTWAVLELMGHVKLAGFVTESVQGLVVATWSVIAEWWKRVREGE